MGFQCYARCAIGDDNGRRVLFSFVLNNASKCQKEKNYHKLYDCDRPFYDVWVVLYFNLCS